MCTNAINTNASDNNISDSGKKKTKLGYHRSSVACAYCRRRKIRCIPSAHGSPRCENCLKHGRECQYLPVDQQIVTKKPLKIDTKARRSHSMTSAVGLVLRPSLENLERFRNAAADQQHSRLPLHGEAFPSFDWGAESDTGYTDDEQTPVQESHQPQMTMPSQPLKSVRSQRPPLLHQNTAPAAPMQLNDFRYSRPPSPTSQQSRPVPWDAFSTPANASTQANQVHRRYHSTTFASPVFIGPSQEVPSNEFAYHNIAAYDSLLGTPHGPYILDNRSSVTSFQSSNSVDYSSPVLLHLQTPAQMTLQGQPNYSSQSAYSAMPYPMSAQMSQDTSSGSELGQMPSLYSLEGSRMVYPASPTNLDVDAMNLQANFVSDASPMMNRMGLTDSTFAASQALNASPVYGHLYPSGPALSPLSSSNMSLQADLCPTTYEQAMSSPTFYPQVRRGSARSEGSNLTYDRPSPRTQQLHQREQNRNAANESYYEAHEGR